MSIFIFWVFFQFSIPFDKYLMQWVEKVHHRARKGWFSWLKRGLVSSWSQVRLPKGAIFVIMPFGPEPAA